MREKEWCCVLVSAGGGGALKEVSRPIFEMARSSSVSTFPRWKGRHTQLERLPRRSTRYFDACLSLGAAPVSSIVHARFLPSFLASLRP